MNMMIVGHCCSQTEEQNSPNDDTQTPIGSFSDPGIFFRSHIR